MLVVVNDGNGQMCNKILFQINILASSYVRKYDVVYYGKDNFDGFLLKQGDLEHRVVYKKEASRPLYNIVRGFHKIFSMTRIGCKKFVMVGANNQQEVNKLLESDYLNKHKTFLYGWPFYDLEALRKAGSSVREYMQPTEELRKSVDIEMNSIRKEYNCVIGVHLRRGDYINWRGGAYYYSNEEYLVCMERLFKMLKLSGKVIFLLFSNEKVEEQDFRNPYFSTKLVSGTAAHDFHMMAKCNYIMGPPSSFSGLASYLGKVPRYMIEDTKKNISPNNLLIWLEETDSWGLPDVKRSI